MDYSLLAMAIAAKITDKQPSPLAFMSTNNFKREEDLSRVCVLDKNDLDSQCPLDNGRHTDGEPQHTLGTLDNVPIEVLEDILSSLDLPSLTAFRAVNRRAMRVVDALKPYDEVYTRCPQVLRAVLSTQTNSYSLRTLHSTLRTSKCDTCDRFGAYLYLITCKRVCYQCFRGPADPERHWLPVPLDVASERAKVPKDVLTASLPTMRRIAGFLGPSVGNPMMHHPKYTDNRDTLVDRRALLKLTPDAEAEAPFEEQDRKEREVQRYAGVVAAPLIRNQEADWGMLCAVCMNESSPDRPGLVHILEADLVSHLEGVHRARLEQALAQGAI